MVWHLVLMKPRPDLSSGERHALVDAFERACRDIPTIREVHVGRRVTHGARYETGMPDTAEYVMPVSYRDRKSTRLNSSHT